MILSRFANTLKCFIGKGADATPEGTPRDFLDELGAEGLTAEAWLVDARTGGKLYVDLEPEAVEKISLCAPLQAGRTISMADDVLAHKFNLLGSGVYTPEDPGRAGAGGYKPIDWYYDPVRALRFPRGVPYKEWDLYKMRPGSADIKYPWELARCQHWAALGQAYRLTGEAKYAGEIASQLDDFMEANPVGIGVNWTCTMDVAIRAANWAIGLALIRGYDGAPAGFWARAYSALFDHGNFIYANFENNYEVTSNHYLSNITGLYYLARVFSDLPRGRAWEEYCRKALEEEITLQVLEDGADYESSVPYHRLVTELFMGSARLAQHAGRPMSQRYLSILRKMVEFHLAVTRPDGLMPQVGDADDGRLHILTASSGASPQDGRHLLAPAAMLLNEPAWLNYAGPDGAWEAGWWGFDVANMETADMRPPDVTASFPDAGLYVAREGGGYLLIQNSIVGTKGFGNHKHNDQLGFEYHYRGEPVIVDPGSYVYTSDPAARNMFRSVASHNTLSVDGQEQNEFNKEWLFRMFETANAKTETFEADDERVVYSGSHSGYMRLEKGGVLHERRLALLRRGWALALLDRLAGEGEHELRWRFHLAPGVAAEKRGENMFALRTSSATLILSMPDEAAGTVEKSWYSPSYGVKMACEAINIELKTEVRGHGQWRFAIAEESWRAAPEAGKTLSGEFERLLSP